jgi:hypothetical protein
VSLISISITIGQARVGDLEQVVQFYWLILGILAVWRISYLLASESGPWNLLGRMRQRLARGFGSELATCLYCLSVWVAAPFASFLGESWKQRLLLWPALSAGAIIVERWVNREPPLPLYYEDREELDQENRHVLRQERKITSI